MPEYDVRETFLRFVAAPAEATMETACALEIESIPLVRVLIALRSVLLHSRPGSRDRRGLVEQMTALGWTPFVRTPRTLVMGAITEPWAARPHFDAVDPATFAELGKPGRVKIVWSVEALRAGEDACVVRSETRAVATDDSSRRRFRLYWLAFGAGTAVIRVALLRRLARIAERRYGKRRAPARVAAAYAGRVFGTGALLGALRERCAAPRLGRTAAVALEAPLMAVATYRAARRLLRDDADRFTAGERLEIGAVALGMLLALEAAGVNARGWTAAEYVRRQRSPAGAIFAALLAWFALAPALVGSRGRGAATS